ncbi:hypothetical protein HMPREF0208_01066 [Citrobacter koseri]|nr:hypothetical protein HMPREF3220_01977 [Citrobacter koseri]KXA04012.1 hypothetical protein HMPREF3207_01592 [Citrobacter koseri]KXB45771.1 hypothetical protein HMPREF0208_01066 [Citrobacter koseri]
MPRLLCIKMKRLLFKTMSCIIGTILSLRHMFSQGIAPWI